jgi:hypothetical protein
LTEAKQAARFYQSNKVKNIIADINASRHQLIKIILRQATSPICSIGQARGASGAVL